MTIPQHPFHSPWQPIEVDVVGYHLVDTIETAALEAIYIFCNQHPMEVAVHPIGLFPAIDSNDSEWNFRIAHYGHMLGDLAEETLRGTIRFLNAQHHYQILLRRGMSQLTSCYRHNLDRPEVGRGARWVWRITIMGLRIGPCADVLGPGRLC
jgi:hypothetical protein